ncbi:MAG: VWA domain-containing protein [Acidobacteria bacterium]|nr:VWA domain-containing protein [Acidobacteriota bacterium]
MTLLNRCLLAATACVLLTPFTVAQAAADGSIPMPGQSSAVPSQQPQSSGAGVYTLKVQSQVVVLDVVVTDKSGNVVNNLSRDDFEIYENDTKQRVRSFERPQSHVLPASKAINGTQQLDKEAPQAPVSIIVLDEMNTRFEDEYFAKYSLKKYLNTQGDTLDQPTMLVAVDLQKFNVLQDYTTSKKDILYALDHHLARYPWHLANGGKSYIGDMFATTYNALMQVAQATQGHPGHKNMLWVGHGLPALDTSLIDDTEALDQLTETMQTCVMLLRDARITLYWIDAGGVKAASATDDTQATDTLFGGGVITMAGMAEATGGKAFFNRNDVDRMIDKSAVYGNSFYTLSYVPSSVSDDPKEFRKIRIVMKNPNYKAIAREGYYPEAPPPPPMLNGKPSDRLVYDLSMAARSMMVYDGVPISVTRETPTGDAFTIHIDESAIEWTDNGSEPRSADIAVLVASFDRKGKMLARNAQNLTATAPALAQGTSSQKRPINIHLKMSAAPPVARMRFVVRVAATGKVGAENVLFVPKSELKDETTYNPKLKPKKPKNNDVPVNSPANILNNREDKARSHRF